MKQLLAWLLLIGAAVAQSVTVTGLVTDSGGNLATSGYVSFQLTPVNFGLAYTVVGTSILAPGTTTCTVNGSGVLKNLTGVSACLIWGNDAVSPPNSLYQVIVAPNGVPAYTLSNVLLTGSAADLSHLTLVSPQPVIGTSLQANPIITMGFEGLLPDVFNVGFPNAYADVYSNYFTAKKSVDLLAISPPANPALGYCRFYENLSSGLLAAINSSGSSCLPTGFPTNAQPGDIVRFDGTNWVAVNYAQAAISLYAVNQLTTLQGFGIFGSSTVATAGNNTTTVIPTTTAQAGLSVGQTAGASLNTVIAANFGENGSTSTIGMEAFYRWSFKAALGGLTNARYWFGLGCHTGGGTGNNGAAFAGTTAYASDTPNKSTVGFLYSAGVASGDFQAEAVTAGGSQTAVDTHVVADTNPHLFEMTTNATGSSILYWIDGLNVATISTNLPPPANTFNSWGDLFFTGDNKNTATAISLTFYSMQISLK